MPLIPYVGAHYPRAFHLNLLAEDPDRCVDALLWKLAPTPPRTFVDIGAGSGFHACRYASVAERLYAVEPDPQMRRQIHGSLAMPGTPENVSVIAAGAEQLPLPDRSIDLVHARFAYFFGTADCLPGLREVRRVLRPGGSFVVIEGSNLGDFGSINRDINPKWFTDQSGVIAFWEGEGFEQHLVHTMWRVPDRATMAEALSMEHGATGAERIMEGFPGCELSLVLRMFHWRAPETQS